MLPIFSFGATKAFCGIFGVALLLAVGFFVEALFNKTGEEKTRFGLMTAFFVVCFCTSLISILCYPVCPNCGEKVNTDYCTYCGQMVEENIVPTCPQCGEACRTDFCGDCGAPVNQED